MKFPTLKFVRTCQDKTLPPIMVESEQGENYLVKASHIDDGIVSNATDWITLRLAGCMGINVPDSDIIHVHPVMNEGGHDLAVKPLLHRTGIPTLALTYLPDAITFEPIHTHSVPEATRRQIFLFDLLMLNVYRTLNHTNMVFSQRQLYCLNFSASVTVRSILMNSPVAEHGLLARLRNHPFFNEYTSNCLGLFSHLDEPVLCAMLEPFPEEWAHRLGQSPESLRKHLTAQLVTLFANSAEILDRRLDQVCRIQAYNLHRIRTHNLRNRRPHSRRR